MLDDVEFVEVMRALRNSWLTPVDGRRLLSEDRKIELVVRRFASRRPARSSGHETPCVNPPLF